MVWNKYENVPLIQLNRRKNYPYIVNGMVKLCLIGMCQSHASRCNQCITRLERYCSLVVAWQALAACRLASVFGLLFGGGQRSVYIDGCMKLVGYANKK